MAVYLLTLINIKNTTDCRVTNRLSWIRLNIIY